MTIKLYDGSTLLSFSGFILKSKENSGKSYLTWGIKIHMNFVTIQNINWKFELVMLPTKELKHKKKKKRICNAPNQRTEKPKTEGKINQKLEKCQKRKP